MLKVECVFLCHNVYYEYSNRTWTYTWNSTSVKVAGNFDFYAVSKRIWQICKLKTGVLEHTVIVVPLNTNCNITAGGCSLVSRETGLWPGQRGFSYQYEQRLSPPPLTNQLLSPPSLQSKGYWGLIPWKHSSWGMRWIYMCTLSYLYTIFCLIKHNNHFTSTAAALTYVRGQIIAVLWGIWWFSFTSVLSILIYYTYIFNRPCHQVSYMYQF